jgi:hypothetical protein
MLPAASLAPVGSTMIAVALPGIGRDIATEASNLTTWLVSSGRSPGMPVRADQEEHNEPLTDPISAAFQ